MFPFLRYFLNKEVSVTSLLANKYGLQNRQSKNFSLAPVCLTNKSAIYLALSKPNLGISTLISPLKALELVVVSY